MGASLKRKQARREKFGDQNRDAGHAVERRAEESEATDDGEGVDLAPKESEKPEVDEKEVKSQRFIAFIGNLPFSATDATIENHFVKLRPSSIRHRVDKTTGKSKGFAFVEFDNYDRLKTCLKLYHHSVFVDDEGQRRINVELTAGGGGGKSQERKAKLRVKNLRLNEQRKNAANPEKDEGKERPKRKLRTDQEDVAADLAHVDVHPSRRQNID